jgi:nucleotide-binding universal stress UspA family protein
MDVDGTSSVVVGVDGSPGSRAALENALQDAARRNGRLRVVAAAPLPKDWAMAYGMAVPLPQSGVLERVRAAAQEMVDAVVTAYPALAAQVPITVEVRSGVPVEVLIEASEGADLLVLGHRGRGALASTVLGSVGLQCVLHATCPVTVVRPSRASLAAEAVPSGAAPVRA